VGPAALDPNAFNAFEAERWEQQAAGYERFFSRITGQLVEPLLDAADVRQGTRMLDVASGPGYVTAHGAARGAHVVGVDVAEAMVLLARRLHPGTWGAPRTPRQSSCVCCVRAEGWR
jgi:SAM-dependent methyltransferase